ncbi:MAG: glycosyltransferase family 4 protein, partial [Planctomycetaceae bacterium]|nr:glycosyltransferase family 4 protein [Planctomycetaceae bacterium]
MSKPRVLFLNRSYWPDTEATGQLLTDLSQDLSQDFQVSVLVGLPNHVTGEVATTKAGRDEHAGVEILRVRHTRFPKHNFVGRILNLVTFSLMALLRGLWLPNRPDIVITETDPFFLPLVGRLLKWRYGCRFVAYLQDIYPEVAIAVGKVQEGFITRMLRWLLVGAYRRADRVIVLSQDMRTLCERNGVPTEKIVVLPNWVDTTSIKPRTEENAFRHQHGTDRFLVMYSGNLGVGHVLTPIIDAAEQLRDFPDVHFLMIGEGQQKARLEQLAREKNLENIIFLPYQPRETLSDSLSAADLHLVSIRPEVVECLMPSKLYGVLAAGVPMIVLAPCDCELAQIVEQHQ